MKKKILLSALVLVALIGVAIGAYMLHVYNENKPLILRCTVSEAPIEPSLVGVARVVRISAPAGGWSQTTMGLTLDSSVEYWNFKEQYWFAPLALEAAKNRFRWTDRGYDDIKMVEIDRSSGEYSATACKDDHEYHFGAGPSNPCAGLETVVVERGSCIKQAEPARTLKQKF